MKLKKMKVNKKLLLITLILGIIMQINVVLATEPYFNSSYGLGLEGFLNYTNLLIDGWLVTAFLAFIWIVVFYVMSKSGWEGVSAAGFAFLVSFIGSLFFALFTTISSYTIFINAIGLGGCIFLSIIKGRN